MTIRQAALPELVAAMQTLARLAGDRGIRFAIADFGGLRTQADTVTILGYRDTEYGIYAAQMRQAGKVPLPINQWRPIAPYGTSYHNYGAARDITITAKPATMTAAQALAVVGSLAPQAGLRWGHSFGDDPHFELPITLDEARRRWLTYIDAGGGSSSSSSAGGNALALLIVAALAIGVALIRTRT